MARDPIPYHMNSFWRKYSIAFMGAACAVFLLFRFYKIIRNHCLASRRSLSLFWLIRTRRRHPNENNPENDPTWLESGGLSTDVIHSLPVVQFREESKEGGDGQSSSDCAICLGEFGEGEWLRLLPNCSHIFHVSCIDPWFQSHSDCPLCRMKVVCDFSDSWSSMSMASPLETLPREDIHRERPLDYHLESEVMQNGEFRARGVQILMWL